MDYYNDRQNRDSEMNNAHSQQPYPPNYYAGQNHGQPYQWDVQNIQRETVAPKAEKHKGVRVFGIVAGVIALVIMAGFATFGAYVAITGETPGIQQFLPAPSSGAGGNLSETMPEVVINDKPSGGSAVATTGLTNQEIFKKVSPSVVGVISYMNADYFGNSSQGQGSGIILSADGYIVTNAHVVSGAAEIDVVMSDDRTFPATVVGSDIQTDLAVIKIDASDLPAAELGNSDQLEVGERVVAIGNPGGMQFASSLTGGYVSALNRVLTSGEVGYALECIQTDAAINPGNSGGALINEYGQVVGINSAKISATDYEGMGFAIPINDAMPIIDDIIANGKVTGRAMLGIQAVAIDAQTAQQSGVPMGIMIKSFTEGNNLESSGAKVGDIITHINSIPVYTTSGSADVLKNYNPGDTVTVSLYRIDVRGRASSFNIDVVLTSS